MPRVKAKPEEVNVPVKPKVFTIKYTNGNNGGLNLVTKDDKKTWAKSVGEKYFIILDERNRLYNHLDFERPTGKSSRRPAKFLRVEKQVFDSYLKFLATNNQYHLNYARRLVHG